MVPEKIERTVVYVDGFNLYFGMLAANLVDCKWLNIRSLVMGLLKPNQRLEDIKYFTSAVTKNPNKQKRQNAYIEALETVGIKVIYGRYQSYPVECRKCGDIRTEQNEKMTDVNIATHIITDAFQDKYDVAILISGDSDLVPPIKAVHELFGKLKRVTVFFPPNRYNASVAFVARGSMVIGKKKLRDSQFAEEVKKPNGFILKLPTEWPSPSPAGS